MSDQLVAPSTPQGGQPEQTPEVSGEGEQGQQNLTHEEVQSMIETAVSQGVDVATEQAFRRAQGYTDSTSATIRENLGQLTKYLELQEKVTGKTVDPQEAERMRQQVIERTLVGEEAAPQGAQPQPPQAMEPGQGPAPGANPLADEINKIMADQGVIIENNDPELAMIDDSSPLKVISSLYAAIDAKKKRTEQSEQPPSDDNQPDDTPIVPGLTSGSPSTDSEFKGIGHGLDRMIKHYDGGSS